MGVADRATPTWSAFQRDGKGCQRRGVRVMSSRRRLGPSRGSIPKGGSGARVNDIRAGSGASRHNVKRHRRGIPTSGNNLLHRPHRVSRRAGRLGQIQKSVPRSGTVAPRAGRPRANTEVAREYLRYDPVVMRQRLPGPRSRPNWRRVTLLAGGLAALSACAVREQPLPDSGSEKPAEFRGVALSPTPALPASSRSGPPSTDPSPARRACTCTPGDPLCSCL